MLEVADDGACHLGFFSVVEEGAGLRLGDRGEKFPHDGAYDEEVSNERGGGLGSPEVIFLSLCRGKNNLRRVSALESTISKNHHCGHVSSCRLHGTLRWCSGL